MHEVHVRVEKLADLFRDSAAEAEDLGRLPHSTAEALRRAGVMRMLQPAQYGGFEAHPVEFLEAVMEVGAASGAAGWVAGLVGVHPWQLGQCDPRLQEEIWGTDPDTWIASPYTPRGRARPVAGGYVLRGRWQFSSGTDHCDWVVLGGLVDDPAGSGPDAPRLRHFVLPSADYLIVHDSWDVVGLRGTGSKDVLVEDAFVPDYRVVDPATFVDGVAARAAGRCSPLYALPIDVVLPSAVAASTVAMAEGALAAFVDHTRDRVTVRGDRAAADRRQLFDLGAAAADVAGSREQLLADLARAFERVASGGTVPPAMTREIRRNQVRAVRRAVDAVDRLLAHAGGRALRLDHPLQRHWRDLHAGLAHDANRAAPVYEDYGRDLLGCPADTGGR